MTDVYISVVMATYNGGKYVREQLESIINQTCPPQEIIIADDCSSDQTLEILDSFKEVKNIVFVSYVNQENLGYIKNFKTAISKAKGDYIFLCDQDDIWENEKIESTVAIMRQHNAEIACSGFTLINDDGDIIKDTSIYKSDPISGYERWTHSIKNISIRRLIWGNFSPGCTYCFTKEVLNVFNKLSNTELSHDFQILLIGSNHHAAIYIDTPLSRYRLHSSNTIGMNNKEAKRKRNFKPRLTRFFDELSKVEKIDHLILLNTILYLRLPKIRSVFIRKLHLNNGLNLRKESEQ